MRPFIHESNLVVSTAIPALADGVMQVLLPMFFDVSDPGNKQTLDEFTGALNDVLFAMLKGDASFEARRVLAKRALPQLIADDSMFGRSAGPGSYLIARRVPDKQVSQTDATEVLEPGSHEFTPLSQATGAFPSFEDACTWLVQHLNNQPLSFDDVRRMGVRVVPVARVTARPEGFVVAAQRW